MPLVSKFICCFEVAAFSVLKYLSMLTEKGARAYALLDTEDHVTILRRSEGLKFQRRLLFCKYKTGITII
jgi:hypothetical protein